VSCQTELATCVTFPGDGVDDPVLSYTDNRDATFTDNNTLLMWEKKVAGGSFGTCDLTANLHGADTTCTWAEATGAWIAAVNATNLGGHHDWRIPNVKELQSLIDYGSINPAFSFQDATANGTHWSSTSLATASSNAWYVDFGSGSVNNLDKGLSRRVRAVRDGR
jgi:hypothetical protein